MQYFIYNTSSATNPHPWMNGCEDWRFVRRLEICEKVGPQKKHSITISFAWICTAIYPHAEMQTSKTNCKQQCLWMFSASARAVIQEYWKCPHYSRVLPELPALWALWYYWDLILCFGTKKRMLHTTLTPLLPTNKDKTKDKPLKGVLCKYQSRYIFQCCVSGSLCQKEHLGQ